MADNHAYKQRVYLVGGLPWGSEYLYAGVWYCGDEVCDCSCAEIERIGPNRTAGPPWIVRERVWEGQFYTDGETGAEADLQQHLAELEASGEIEVVTRQMYAEESAFDRLALDVDVLWRFNQRERLKKFAKAKGK